ncbi:protein-disulfide reductase DsbD domain-containing protein [Paenirhodobacter sp.]|uniref:protein-disulfide reductase DsbD domain-containing protein n=1 Tax=Paenirhodobacter sp. TaxID=1965326 RepID=UPI003B3E3E27
MKTPVAIVLGACLALPAAAQDALPPGVAGAEVLPGWRTPEGDYIAALKIELDAGWKTYWRVPGDAGIPPVLNFAESDNVTDVAVIWPAPEVFDQNGLRTVGYRNELVLPIRIRPRDPAAPVELDAMMDIGVCHDICVPVSLDLEAAIDGPGAPDAEIRRAMEAAPVPRPGHAQCSGELISDGMRVTARIDLPPEADEVAMFELRSTPMWVSEPVMRREGRFLVATVDFVPDDGRPFALDPQDLRITVLGAGGAVQIDGCPSEPLQAAN